METETIVYRLAAGCDLSDVEEGKIYLGKVQGFATFGMFVQLNDRIKGLVHKTSMKADHKEKDSVLVRVRQIRPNGNIDLEEQQIQIYQVQQVERTSTTVRIAELPAKQGKSVAIEGEVAQIKQTSGPTIFTIVDESGTQNVAAFVEAGVRAYPEASAIGRWERLQPPEVAVLLVIVNCGVRGGAGNHPRLVDQLL